MPLLLSRNLFAASSLVAVCLAGCSGGSDIPELGTVAGILTDGGTPVPDATIEFYPASGRPSFATTGPDGRYAMSYAADLPGAVVGTHSVRITTAGKPRKGTPANSEEPVVGPTKVRAMPSPVQVVPGENTIDLDLANTR